MPLINFLGNHKYKATMKNWGKLACERYKDTKNADICNSVTLLQSSKLKGELEKRKEKRYSGFPVHSFPIFPLLFNHALPSRLGFQGA